MLLPYLPIVNNTAMNMGTLTFFLISVLGSFQYIPRSGNYWDYWVKRQIHFNFLRYLHTAFNISQHLLLLDKHVAKEAGGSVSTVQGWAGRTWGVGVQHKGHCFVLYGIRLFRDDIKHHQPPPKNMFQNVIESDRSEKEFSGHD